MPNFLLKPTPLLLAGIMVVLAGLYFLYDALRNDPTGMGAGFIGLVLMATLVLIALDRLAVTYLPMRPLVIAETLLLAIGIGWFAFSARTSVIDCSANKADYFVIILTNDQPTTPAFVRKWPFSQVATVSDRQVFEVNEVVYFNSTVTSPSHWQGTFSRGIELTHPRYKSAYFFGEERYLDRESDVDSLLDEAVVK
jgi:hypothetical protein